MRLSYVGAVLAAVLFTGCTYSMPRRYVGAEPIAPAMGYSYEDRFPPVDSLQPELKWKDIKKPNQTYDVSIWESPGARVAQNVGTEPKLGSEYLIPYQPAGASSWGRPVYYADNIAVNYHRVTKPLKPDRTYSWSVRAHEGNQVTNWSYFNQHTTKEAVVVSEMNLYKNVPFGFKTPGLAGGTDANRIAAPSAPKGPPTSGPASKAVSR
jgi:hypothetical protein